MKLYFHQTDGGAKYLMDRFIECPDGSKEGIFEGATIIVRIDGDITKDAEIEGRCLNAHDDLVAALEDATDELAHCGVIVGDPMYAAVKRDYRAKVAGIVQSARAALAKAAGAK